MLEFYNFISKNQDLFRMGFSFIVLFAIILIANMDRNNKPGFCLSLMGVVVGGFVAIIGITNGQFIRINVGNCLELTSYKINEKQENLKKEYAYYVKKTKEAQENKNLAIKLGAQNVDKYEYEIYKNQKNAQEYNQDLANLKEKIEIMVVSKDGDNLKTFDGINLNDRENYFELFKLNKVKPTKCSEEITHKAQSSQLLTKN